MLGEGEGWSAAEATALGAGTEVTLASNWAAGLENIVVGERSSAVTKAAQTCDSIVDIALLATQDEDAEPFTDPNTVQYSLLDEVFGGTAETEDVPVAEEGGDVRDKLLASFF